MDITVELNILESDGGLNQAMPTTLNVIKHIKLGIFRLGRQQ